MTRHCKATAEWVLVEWVPRKGSGALCRSLVPQTDTGIRDEYSQARELNLSKELGKLAPYLRYKGRPARGRSEMLQPTV
jgi:hypothetical protein